MGVTCLNIPSVGKLAWPHQDTLLILKPSIVFDFFNQTVACCLLFIAYNVNVWMMLPFIQVILPELCRLQPSWTEQSWFVNWREGGTLCLRGFFSVNSNDGAELSSPFLLSARICVFLCPLEDWAGHSHSENTPQCHQWWQLLQQHGRERSRPLLHGLKCVNTYKYLYL